MLSSMENHIKHKITRIFRSSFGSCKTKNITDAIDDDKPVFHPQNPQFFSDIFPSKPRPFPSICRPAAEVDHRILFPRPKISDQSSPLFPPPAASKHKKKKKTTRADFPAFGYKGLFSSDEETEDEDDDDRATLFSSVSFSFSSDSSESFRRRRAERIRRRRRRAARKRRGAEEKEEKEAAMKDSMAVVKRSRDPCADFRASMLEMIMEKQIFGAKDLEKLLDCYLSLNSHHHHGVIIQVFTEICEALFSNYCP